jgi:hypothetical protein
MGRVSAKRKIVKVKRKSDENYRDSLPQDYQFIKNDSYSFAKDFHQAMKTLEKMGFSVSLTLKDSL